MRRTKIVCTVGPASDEELTLKRMADAGMDLARINFSHGTLEEQKSRIERIRNLRNAQGRRIGIIGDLPGPKIRTGDIENGSVRLKKGQEIVLTGENVLGNREIIQITYPDLWQDIQEKDVILLSEGLIILNVLEINPPHIKCLIKEGGVLTPKRAVNLPGVYLKLENPTERDFRLLEFIAGQHVDFVALSFVRSADEVRKAKAHLEKLGSDMGVIAKIEKREAIGCLEEILEESDAVMVARGDLGAEMLPEEVPLIQKAIIKLANRKGKPVITATQMLESMMESPRPTRAEASDVANAIFDGTDAVMLSGETAAGKYPIEAIRLMNRITEKAEGALDYHALHLARAEWARDRTAAAVSYSACELAEALEISTIITPTRMGTTAGQVAKCRPKAKIIAPTPNESTYGRLLLLWGAYPLLVKERESLDEMLYEAVEAAETAGMVKKGEQVVMVAGIPKAPGTTNLIKLHTV